MKAERVTMKRIEQPRALVYVPEQRGGPLPVLCFLHGAGEAATDAAGKPQPLGKLLANRSPAWHAENGSPFVSRFLVVCPQLERRRRWEPSDASHVDAIVDAAIGHHGGDPARLFLTGFSYGGEGAFRIALASPRWGTVWAVDPAIQRVPEPPAKDTRVWIHHGRQQPGAENMAAFAITLALADWASDVHARRILTVLDTDHPATCTAAYAEAHVYDWLLQAR